MFNDFFIRALVAGIGVAFIAAPLGCFIVWRRISYFGDTLAHASLLGITFAYLLDINIMLAVFVNSILVASGLILLQKIKAVGSDAILGILSHSSLALGIVFMSFMTWLRIDLTTLLFGDILSVSNFDLLLIYAGGFFVLLILALIWHDLFAVTVNEELATAEGVSPGHVNLSLIHI